MEERGGRRRVSTSSDSEISDGWNLIDAVDILPTEISDAESVEVLHEEFSSEIETQGNTDVSQTENRVSEIGPSIESAGSFSVKELFEVSAVLAVLVAVALSSSYMLLALEDGFYAVKPALLGAILPSEHVNNELALSVEALRLENKKLNQKLIEIDKAYSSLKRSAIERYHAENFAAVDISTLNPDNGDASVDVSAGIKLSTDSGMLQLKSKDIQKTDNSAVESKKKYRLNDLSDPYINTEYVINIVSAFKNLSGADISIRLLHDVQEYFDILQILSDGQMNKKFVDKWEKKFSKVSDNLKLDIDNMLAKLLRHVNRTIVSVQTKFISKLCNVYWQENDFKNTIDNLLTSGLKEICLINNLDKSRKQNNNKKKKTSDLTQKHLDKVDEFSSSTNSNCDLDECSNLNDESSENRDGSNILETPLKHDAVLEVKKNHKFKKDKSKEPKEKTMFDDRIHIQSQDGFNNKHKIVDYSGDMTNNIKKVDDSYETKEKRNYEVGDKHESKSKKDDKKHTNAKKAEEKKVQLELDHYNIDCGTECNDIKQNKQKELNHEYESKHYKQRNGEKFINKEYKNSKVVNKGQTFDQKNLNKMGKTENGFEGYTVETKSRKENKHGDHIFKDDRDNQGQKLTVDKDSDSKYCKNIKKDEQKYKVGCIKESLKASVENNRYENENYYNKNIDYYLKPSDNNVETHRNNIKNEGKGLSKEEIRENKESNQNILYKFRDEESNEKKHKTGKKYKIKDKEDELLHKNTENNENQFDIYNFEESRNNKKKIKNEEKIKNNIKKKKNIQQKKKDMHMNKDQVRNEEEKIGNVFIEKNKVVYRDNERGAEETYIGGKQCSDVGNKYETNNKHKRGEIQERKENDQNRNKKKNKDKASENKHNRDLHKKKENYGKAGFRSKYNSSSETWFLSLGKFREHLRSENHKSDWWFDRARARQGNKRETSNWFFDRAWVRHRCRMNPKPAWCNSHTNPPKDIFSTNSYNVVR